jgi:hypothetical protein
MDNGYRKPKYITRSKPVAQVRFSVKHILMCYNCGLKGHITKERRRLNVYRNRTLRNRDFL